MFNKRFKINIYFKRLIFLIFSSFIFFNIHPVSSQTKDYKTFVVKDTSSLIYKLMMTRPDIFKRYIDSVDQFEIQIIYTQINRDKHNNPSFTQYTYRVNDSVYFNPASLVKLPVLLMSLEKLNNLNVKKINKYTLMHFDSVHSCQLNISNDTNAPSGKPCVAHYIRQILLVSNNQAYNRLYEFLGQQYINERLHTLGYEKTCIIQKFMGCTYDENKYSPIIQFYNKKKVSIYKQPMLYNEKNYFNPLDSVKKGNAYLDTTGNLINAPKDFSRANNLPLQVVNDLFLYTIFPEAAPKEKQMNLTKSDHQFLMKYFAMYPRESGYKQFSDTSQYPDNLKKYFFYKRSEHSITNDNLRILNIVGQAWGWLADCAYFVDFKNKREFLLTAVVYNVTDGIIDPAHYRTDTIGFPFLTSLGQLFYDYELSRPHAYDPNLKKVHKAVFGKEKMK